MPSPHAGGEVVVVVDVVVDVVVVIEVSGLAHQQQIPEAADMVIEGLDLLENLVGRAAKHRAVGDGAGIEAGRTDIGAREFPGLAREAMSDPNARETFLSSDPFARAPDAERWRAFYRDLLTLRAREIVPRLKGARALGANAINERAVVARWRLGDGSRLTIAANFGDAPLVTLERCRWMRG